MQNVSVSCKNLIKIYDNGFTKVTALRGINLDVYSGELLILAGPSGCGKTTFISVIAGILNQNEGDCLVNNFNIYKMKEREKINFRARSIGFVFQQFNLIPTLTIAENAAVPLIINGSSRHEAKKKAIEILSQVGLADKVNMLPAQLSSGQQQRVAIARAIVHEPKLVVCDEPTSALDGETGHKVMKLLKSLAVTNDRTLIVVTHDARIFEYADRIATMEDGLILKVEKKNGRSKNK